MPIATASVLSCTIAVPGILADAELRRDFLIPQTPSHETQDIDFSWRQRRSACDWASPASVFGLARCGLIDEIVVTPLLSAGPQLTSAGQNCFAIPACFSTAFAVCRDRIGVRGNRADDIRSPSGDCSSGAR
jgi:hypothetical protein